jgi:heme exporter protein D
MDTRLILVLVDAAVVVLALLVLGGKKAKAKRRGRRGELRRKARHERIAAEKHRARAEAAEELARERAERDQLKLNCTSAGPVRSIRIRG